MIDWDAYRARYDEMPYIEVAAFHRTVWDAYPDQEHHSPEHLAAFFAGIDARRVLEVGGWRGSAAGRTLAAHPAIVAWTNYEVCEPAVRAPLTDDPRYRPIHPPCWPWEVTLPSRYDTAVLAHVIEHMRARQLERLVEWVAAAGVRDVYVETPLREGPRSWRRANSAHLIELGWSGVRGVFAAAGYACRESYAEPPERHVMFLRSVP